MEGAHGGAAWRAEAPVAVVGNHIGAEIDRQVARRTIDPRSLAIADRAFTAVDARNAECAQRRIVEALCPIEVGHGDRQVVKHG
jgi:hypothetical protein